MKTNQIHIKGKVQGVYFRVSAKQKAMNLGVNGYIKNEPDGTVRLEVEGDDKAVNNMINWCKSGPALARVAEIEVTPNSPKNFTSFKIKK